MRQQIADLYAAQRVEGGRVLRLNSHRDDGYYGYTPEQDFERYRMKEPPDQPSCREYRRIIGMIACSADVALFIEGAHNSFN